MDCKRCQGDHSRGADGGGRLAKVDGSGPQPSQEGNSASKKV